MGSPSSLVLTWSPQGGDEDPARLRSSSPVKPGDPNPQSANILHVKDKSLMILDNFDYVL